MTPEQKKLAEIFRYSCRTLTGRLRARCSFTQACNTGFQGLSSDCSKLAMWNLTKAGYKMTDFIHDETISIIPLDPLVTNRAQHIESIMVNSMKLLTPDVKVKAEPALMYRWAKSAEMYYAGETLLPWELVPKNEKGKAIDWHKVPTMQQTRIIDRLNYLYDEAERIRKM